MNKIRVLIVDDHAVLRSGLRHLINAQPDMEVVGEASQGIEALNVIRQQQPEVICLDWSISGESGLELLATVKAQGLSGKIVILTMHDQPEHFQAAMRAGALAYVVKTASDSELIIAIRAAYAGRTFISMPATHSMNLSPLVVDPPSQEVPLSDRERQVLLSLAAGHTNKEIGKQLGLSMKTIETYRARLLTKLGMKTRPELVQYALEQGLLKKSTDRESEGRLDEFAPR